MESKDFWESGGGEYGRWESGGGKVKKESGEGE